MKQIKIADTTLCREGSTFSFKEKIEIARQLERLCVDVIEIPEIENEKTDILFVKTVSSFVKDSIISVAAGKTIKSIEDAASALVNAKKARIRIELPVSPALMEYTMHKKGPKMLEWIKEAVALAKEKTEDVEFCALDATRVDADFLESAINAAIEAGATCVSICDSAAEMLPDAFAEFVGGFAEKVSVPVCVACENKNGFANAAAALSVKNGADCVKTSVSGSGVALDVFANMIRNCGNNLGFSSNIKTTEIYRIVNQINWIIIGAQNSKLASAVSEDMGIHLDANDSAADVSNAVAKLGYDLSEDDKAKVYEEFLRVAEKKKVGAKELDAIVASVALQVPSTYQLVSYVINNGNIITASAQIALSKNGETIMGVSIGDGPIDAAFLAIDQIIGHHYELDDFQIQSVTEGKEAMGSAIVKLRSGGKLYSGNGISTDIIGASIRAYINAVNKIVYEEV